MLWIQTPGEKRVAAAPVTNLQWKRFLDESGYVPGEEDHDGDYLKHWVDGQPLEDQMNRPVVYISYINAWAYCDFYGYRLPTVGEAQTPEDHGVWEWFEDKTAASNRSGYSNDRARVVRYAHRYDHFSPQFCNYDIGFRVVQDIAPQQTSPTQAPSPWVGKLRHDRSEGSDWGWIRDEAGALICVVTVPKDADLDGHRRNGTDPTQARVDALLKGETVHGPDMVLVPRDLFEKLIEQSHSVYKDLAALASEDGDK